VEKWQMIQHVAQTGIVAVIRKADPEQIPAIADALVQGGVKTLEITADTTDVFDVIARVKKQFNTEIMVGAGTVLDAPTAKRAIDAGADFIFSPHVDIETITLTQRYGKLSIPGAMTPSEVVRAYQAGGDIIKIFPASSLGPKYIKELKGPLSHIPMMPTGGVTVDNAASFIQNGAIAVGAGGSLLDRKVLQTKDYDTLTDIARQFTTVIRQAKQSV
jgi:2-dehydro-3-deoxyphosphogluconate aldolase / (4S)-4-hydroxy-2-oxoglutarate aldolase